MAPGGSAGRPPPPGRTGPPELESTRADGPALPPWIADVPSLGEATVTLVLLTRTESRSRCSNSDTVNRACSNMPQGSVTQTVFPRSVCKLKQRAPSHFQILKFRQAIFVLYQSNDGLPMKETLLFQYFQQNRENRIQRISRICF